MSLGPCDSHWHGCVPELPAARTVEIQSTSLTEIGPGAFIDRIRLATFELPQNSNALSVLGSSAFANTLRLRTFDLGSVNSDVLRAAFGTGSRARDRNFAFQTGFSYVDCSRCKLR